MTQWYRNETDSHSEGTGWPNHPERHRILRSQPGMSQDHPPVDPDLPAVAGRSFGCSNYMEAGSVGRQCSMMSIVRQLSCSPRRAAGFEAEVATVAGQGSLHTAKESMKGCSLGCTTRRPWDRKTTDLGQRPARSDRIAGRQVALGVGLSGLQETRSARQFKSTLTESRITTGVGWHTLNVRLLSGRPGGRCLRC